MGHGYPKKEGSWDPLMRTTLSGWPKELYGSEARGAGLARTHPERPGTGVLAQPRETPQLPMAHAMKMYKCLFQHVQMGVCVICSCVCMCETEFVRVTLHWRSSLTWSLTPLITRAGRARAGGGPDGEPRGEGPYMPRPGEEKCHPLHMACRNRPGLLIFLRN